MDTTPSWIKVIISKTFTNKSANVYMRGWVNFGDDTVLSESPNFIDFWMLSVNTTDELGSVFVPTTIIINPKDGSNCLMHGHGISEAKEGIVGRVEAKNHYNFKIKFETS